MSVVPCDKNVPFQKRVNDFADLLATRLHEFLPDMTEEDIYSTGLFRSAVERIRGQISATMGPKRQFVSRILNYLQDVEAIQEWIPAGAANRHDYEVVMPSGRRVIIELKGCLDGNNTNIFQRPANAEEFIIWSVCSNAGADPRKNVWSGIHTRLSAESITKNTQIDGVIVWDNLCGTDLRPCPKLARAANRQTAVGPDLLPPPCLYIFPATVAHPRTNQNPAPQALARVEFMHALHLAFGGMDDEVNYVSFEVQNQGPDTYRRSKIVRDGAVQKESPMTKIKRTSE